MENDPLTAKDRIQSIQYNLLEEDTHRMTTASPEISHQVPSEASPNLHADDEKWSPKDDLAYYETIEPGNHFENNIDLEDAPSGSDFNIYDIEDDPIESPPTESMLKKSKFSPKKPPSVIHQKKALAGPNFPQD
jgi:hypothetical protein